jgi:hypothetical protein
VEKYTKVVRSAGEGTKNTSGSSLGGKLLIKEKREGGDQEELANP